MTKVWGENAAIPFDQYISDERLRGSLSWPRVKQDRLDLSQSLELARPLIRPIVLASLGIEPSGYYQISNKTYQYCYYIQ